MKLRRPIILIACVFISAPLLSAPRYDWKEVRVTKQTSEAEGCESVGMLHARVDSFWGSNTASVYSRLKMKAAEKRANLVILLADPTVVEKTNGSDIMADGEAFRCDGGLKPLAALKKEDTPSAEAPAPDASGTACAETFQTSGSKLRGRAYSASVDVPSLSGESGFDLVLAGLESEQLELVHGDRVSGSIFTEANNPGRRIPVDFQITAQPSGARIGVSLKLRAGMFANDQGMMNEICHLLNEITTPRAAQAVDSTDGTTSAGKASSGTAEQRLIDLDASSRRS
jgi:hypothetical protein